MALFDGKKALTREKRCGAISHYHGTFASLLRDGAGNEYEQRIRTFSQSGPGEIVYALQALNGIPGVAVVIHGGAGCAATGLRHGFSRGAAWYTTNLNESDTILGGDKKLRAAAVRAYKENSAEIIFIVGTPVNAINNDDIEAVILELEEEIACPVVYVAVNGFETKNALSGYDAVFHAFLKHITRPPQKPEEPFINLFSVSENPGNVAAVAKLLAQINIPCNLSPGFSGVEGIRRASSALFSVSLNDTEGGYFLAGLEEQYGVPFVKTSPPVGRAATAEFLLTVAGRFGRGKEAEDLIRRETRAAAGVSGRKPLAGKTIFLEMDISPALGFSALAEELGGGITGLSIPYFDPSYAAALNGFAQLSPAAPLIVAQGQQFELINTLAKHPSDFFVGASGSAAAVSRLGIYPLPTDNLVFYGYRGVEETFRQILKAQTKIFPPNTVYSPYSPAWLKRSGNWYVKVEVK
jgi:nitrogenase molybdenum-iron protein alpha chain